MIDYSQLMKGCAAYMPASPLGYAEYPVSPAKEGERSLPAGLAKSDLNYLTLDGSLFHYDKSLMSAGLVLGKNSTRFPNPMITDLKHRLLTTTVLWDGGGYQLITDRVIFQGDKTRKRTLHAIEHFADVAAVIDIPPLCLSVQFPTYEISRDTTVENLRYFAKHRRGGAKPIFLNVLHGLTPDQADDWYAHVKDFPMEGWAFGTIYKRKLTELLRRLVILCDDNLMDARVWLHLFGTNRLALTCALTTIQTVLSRLLGRFVQVSYDTSSPFTSVYASRLAYIGYAIDKSGLAMRHRRFPNGDCSSDWEQLAFPTCFPSAMANRLKLSDICLPGKSIFASSTWDDLSYHLIANHNLEVLLNAIIGAHRIYLMDENNAAGLCPEWLIRTRIGIEEVLTAVNPMSTLEKYAADFDLVRSGGRCLSASDHFNYYDDTFV